MTNDLRQALEEIADHTRVLYEHQRKAIRVAIDELDRSAGAVEACREALPVLERAIAAACDDDDTMAHALAHHTILVKLRKVVGP